MSARMKPRAAAAGKPSFMKKLYIVYRVCKKYELAATIRSCGLSFWGITTRSKSFILGYF